MRGVCGAEVLLMRSATLVRIAGIGSIPSNISCNSSDCGIDSLYTLEQVVLGFKAHWQLKKEVIKCLVFFNGLISPSVVRVGVLLKVS